MNDDNDDDIDLKVRVATFCARCSVFSERMADLDSKLLDILGRLEPAELEEQ